MAIPTSRVLGKILTPRKWSHLCQKAGVPDEFHDICFWRYYKGKDIGQTEYYTKITESQQKYLLNQWDDKIRLFVLEDVDRWIEGNGEDTFFSPRELEQIQKQM